MTTLLEYLKIIVMTHISTAVILTITLFALKYWVVGLLFIYLADEIRASVNYIHTATGDMSNISV